MLQEKLIENYCESIFENIKKSDITPLSENWQLLQNKIFLDNDGVKIK